MSVATARHFVLRVGVAMALGVAFATALAGSAAAQGVTTSAARGTVTDLQNQPVAGATVLLSAGLTGQRFQGVTNENGRFYITNVPVGSYAVEARAVGYRPARIAAVTLYLGQSSDIVLRMEAATVEVSAIEVTGAAINEVNSQTRTGAATLVTDSAIRSLPSLNRNFQDFVSTVPQVVAGVGSSSAGVSVGGANNRYNNIQIDGSVNNDLFGLAGSGVPGGQAAARPISVEAIKEYQVLIAPFDVRQGGFTGGLINAVTQSGTNRFRASIFGFHQNDGWTGKDTLGNRAADFSQTQYGFTLAGPVVRDRLHFFTAVELQTNNTPFSGQFIGSDTASGRDSSGVGIRRMTAEAVQRIARDSSFLGFDPGTFTSPTIETPGTNIFAKLSFQPSVNNTIELSYNHVDGHQDQFARNATRPSLTSSSANAVRDGYQLSNSGYQQANKTNTFRAIWRRPFGSRVNNEMILAYQTIRDARQLAANVPLILIGGDRAPTLLTHGTNPQVDTLPTTWVAIGGERFSHANSLDQNIFEFTNNVSLNIHPRHTLTIGTHNEFFNFNNVFFQGRNGIWAFKDTLALMQRRPMFYELTQAGANGVGPIADFGVNQIGFYIQDQITPSRRLTLDLGIRLDVPMIDRPSYNPLLDTSRATVGPTAGQALGIRSDNFPVHNALWSPRFGFNYDVNGNGTTIVRGGIGVFSGRPPYVWVSNAFVNTGLEQLTLRCDAGVTGYVNTPPPGQPNYADTVPAFTTDIANLPQTCRGGVAGAAAAASIVYFDPNTKLPQVGKLAIGIDRQLPWNMVATFDFGAQRFLNALFLTDVNLVPGGRSVAEADRQLYGSFAANGTATPRRMTTRFRDIIRQNNTGKDYSYQLTFQLQKRFSNGLEFNSGYTYSRTRDLMTLTSSISNSNLTFSVLDGTLARRNLRPSVTDVPHTVRFNVTGNLPAHFKGTIQYVGRSGTPFTYVTSGDANADGMSGNDPVYVPRNSQDMNLCPASGTCAASTTTGVTPTDPTAWALLDAYIKSEPCLSEARGSILRRNACRNPWQSFVNARLAWSLPTVSGQRLEITADMFNLLSFLGIGGQIRETSFFENTNLLSVAGYSSAIGRPLYRNALPIRNRVSVSASRWRLLLGARYSL